MSGASPVPARVVKEARALLARLTIRNFSAHEHRRGIYWSGILCIDGKDVLLVEQEGQGGANRYERAAGLPHQTAVETQALLEGACMVLGLGDDGMALDLLTAAMEPGKTGREALAAALAFMAE